MGVSSTFKKFVSKLKLNTIGKKGWYNLTILKRGIDNEKTYWFVAVKMQI